MQAIVSIVDLAEVLWVRDELNRERQTETEVKDLIEAVNVEVGNHVVVPLEDVAGVVVIEIGGEAVETGMTKVMKTSKPVDVTRLYRARPQGLDQERTPR